MRSVGLHRERETNINHPVLVKEQMRCTSFSCIKHFFKLILFSALYDVCKTGFLYQCAKTENVKKYECCCSPVFYAVVRFAVFSFHVLCCTAARCCTHHKVGVKRRGKD